MRTFSKVVTSTKHIQNYRDVINLFLSFNNYFLSVESRKANNIKFVKKYVIRNRYILLSRTCLVTYNPIYTIYEIMDDVSLFDLYSSYDKKEAVKEFDRLANSKY